MADVVRANVTVLENIVAQIAELTRRIEHFMHCLPDGLLMIVVPACGPSLRYANLPNWAMFDVRALPRSDQLAAEAGTVQVTYQSAKARSMAFRWACNHRQRRAITCLADIWRQPTSGHAASTTLLAHAAATRLVYAADASSGVKNTSECRSSDRSPRAALNCIAASTIGGGPAT